MPKRTQLTDAEREQRRAADREFVQQAVEQLRSSEGWQRWLTTRRHFHVYSLTNQLLIAAAMPHATRVAGFKAWLKLGYCVRRGERAVIRIWIPIPPSKAKLEAWRAAGADPAEKPRTFFRLGPVWDTLSRVRVGGQFRVDGSRALCRGRQREGRQSTRRLRRTKRGPEGRVKCAATAARRAGGARGQVVCQVARWASRSSFSRAPVAMTAPGLRTARPGPVRSSRSGCSL